MRKANNRVKRLHRMNNTNKLYQTRCIFSGVQIMKPH